MKINPKFDKSRSKVGKNPLKIDQNQSKMYQLSIENVSI